MSLFKKNPAKQVCEDLAELGIDYVDPKKVKSALETIKNGYKQKGYACFVSDFELIVQIVAEREVPYPFEGYAEEICDLFSQKMDWNDRKPKLRRIGEKMDDSNQQMLTAWRANYLCNNKYKSGNDNCGDFSIRYLESAWAGLGGWLP